MVHAGKDYTMTRPTKTEEAIRREYQIRFDTATLEYRIEAKTMARESQILIDGYRERIAALGISSESHKVWSDRIAEVWLCLAGADAGAGEECRFQLERR